MIKIVEKIALVLGRSITKTCFLVGDFSRFLYRALRSIKNHGFAWKMGMQQIVSIGVGSLPIIILTGLFTGLALAFQAFTGFCKFGIEDLTGSVVATGMTRELGPVLTALMVIARAGSAMTAEIGTMRISEQIDALKTLQVNPYRYLVTPRLFASTIIMPCLTMFAALCGIAGGYFFCIYVLDLNAEAYITNIKKMVDMSDICVGLIKSFFFGFVIAWVGTYFGYRTSDGARGVGLATTQSVVTGSVLVLVLNYLLNSILFQIGVG